MRTEKVLRQLFVCECRRFGVIGWGSVNSDYRTEGNKFIRNSIMSIYAIYDYIASSRSGTRDSSFTTYRYTGSCNDHTIMGIREKQFVRNLSAFKFILFHYRHLPLIAFGYILKENEDEETNKYAEDRQGDINAERQSDR